MGEQKNSNTTPVVLKYEDLTIKSNFIFSKVISIKKNCKPLLERCTKRKISNNFSIDTEKTTKIAVDGKGVRYDIYVDDSPDALFDIEMQQDDTKTLPKRSRFYEELIDLSFLESGADYGSLPDSYVIFLCTFDPFGLGLCCYEFENICVNIPDDRLLKLGDGRKILIFNTKGTIKNVDDDMYRVLQYIETGEATDDYTRQLDEAVCHAKKNRKWRADYMIMTCHDADMKREGRKEGIKVGIKTGAKKIAHNLKAEGIPIEVIIKTTGLNKDEIENLR